MHEIINYNSCVHPHFIESALETSTVKWLDGPIHIHALFQ